MAGSYNTVINLFIGELSFLNCTDNMMSIDHVRVAEAVSSSTVIEIYDDTALVVDAAIASNEGGKIQFEYGYSGGAMSERYEATITKYGTEFIGFGALCTIECVSTGVVDAALSNDSAVNKKYYGSISDIVYQVASEENWSVGKIEATKVSDTYEVTRGEESASDFVSELLSKAVSAESGKGGYSFRLAEHEGTTYVYFARSIDEDTSEELNPYDYQYVLGMPNEKVISFNPQYNEVLTALIGASVVKGAAVDPETNETVEVTVSSDAENSLGLNLNTTRRVAGNTYTQSELTSMATSLYEAASMLSYNATLVIRGTPRIAPNTKVSILVLTREGQKHHSSGTYLVLSVEDLVENGGYTTTLELMKNSSTGATVTVPDATPIVDVPGDGGGNEDPGTPSTGGGSNSPLVSYTKLSPNHSGKRTKSIDRITPHCVVGQCSVETLGSIFAPSSRQASCNYGIGKDGRVGMYCEEKNRSWCTSSSANDQRAVTIECASDTEHPYTMNNTVYNKLIDLCVDICRRNKKTKLVWFANKDKTLSYSPKPNEMVLTVHRWFANKSCPGDWLYNRLGDLAVKVTSRLSGTGGPIPVTPEIRNQNMLRMYSRSRQVTESDIIKGVAKYLGTPYLLGGDSWEEGGFDCSGFVWHFLCNECYSYEIGDRVTVAELARRGTEVPYDSSYSQMKVGDLCYQEDNNGNIVHVALYLGSGKIAHVSPATGAVRCEMLKFTPGVVRRYL